MIQLDFAFCHISTIGFLLKKFSVFRFSQVSYITFVDLIILETG